MANARKQQRQGTTRRSTRQQGAPGSGSGSGQQQQQTPRQRRQPGGGEPGVQEKLPERDLPDDRGGRRREIDLDREEGS
jgi:hypothetical protein